MAKDLTQSRLDRQNILNNELAIQEIQEFYQKELGTNQFWNEIEFIAIDHMYISTTVRLIRAHGKNYKELIGELVDKFKREFPIFQKWIREEK